MKSLKSVIFISVVLLLIGISVWKMTDWKTKERDKKIFSALFSPEKYDSLKKTITQLKNNSGTDPGKQRQAFVNLVCKKLHPFWYETEWDFNGTTEIPGQGNIACGYFVTTVLRDAGVKLNRIKLAVCASEEMIKSLTTEQYIKRFSNIKLEKFCSAIEKYGKGVFVVGLDSHTGFLVNEGDSLFFVHANGYGWSDKKVIREYAENSPVLEHSAYRVVGLLTEDEKFLQRWAENN